jgi:hypothetical protein
MQKCVIQPGRCVSVQGKRCFEGEVIDLIESDATRLIQKGTVALWRPAMPSPTPEPQEPALAAPEPQDEPKAPPKRRRRKKGG